MKKIHQSITSYFIMSIFIASLFQGVSVSPAALIAPSSSQSYFPDSYVIKGVPYVSQETNLFCAYAGYTMLLNYQANANTSLREVLYLAGVGYSLLYPIPSKDRLPITGTLICQSEDYIASYFGYITETWRADTKNLSFDICWNEYWPRVKENVSNNTPLITSVNPYRLSSIRKLVNFIIPDLLIDTINASAHAIVLVGYNESNETVCYMDPVTGYFGHPEFGTYAWMDLPTFKKSLEDVNKTIGYPFRISKIRKSGSVGLSQQERFEKAHTINIERLKGNASAYIASDLEVLSQLFNFSDCRLGINATTSVYRNFEKGENNRITTIRIYKKIGKLGIQHFLAVHVLPILLKILHLPSYANQKFSQNKFDKIAIEKEYTADYLIENGYIGEAALFQLESQVWRTLAEYYNVFLKKGVFLSLPRALIVMCKMQTTVENIIDTESQIMNASSLDFDQNITLVVNANHVASFSAGIIKNTTLTWYGKGYYQGVNTRFSKKTPTKNTIYMGASISKTITATALMQLYEKGLFHLTDNVSLYLPFDLKNPYFPHDVITIQMLLNHTSSLNTTNKKTLLAPFFSYFTGYPLGFIEATLQANGSLYKKGYWCNDSAPGTDFRYANMGFVVLEYLVEYFSHQTFEDYCQEHIFTPLQMYNTSFHYNSSKRGIEAPAYRWKNGRFIRYPFYDVPVSGAGGLRTTVEDLSHFLIAHMNNGVYHGVRILNDSTARLMHNASSVTDQWADEFREYHIPNYISYYGLGWMVYNSSYYHMDYSGHDGDNPGSHAIMRMSPSNKLGLIIFWDSDAKFELYQGPWDVWLPLEKELLKKAKDL